MKKPNLIYIFADQWRRQALGFMNEDPVITPCIDSFAKESVVVEHAISSCPLCSPHRASLMTGKYPISVGVYTNCKTGLDVYLRPQENSFANVLKKQGYKTGYIGKWHLDNPGLNPEGIQLSEIKGWDAYTPPGEARLGFDFWYSYGADDNHLRPHYWKDDSKALYVNKWSVEHETDIAIDFINNNKRDEPFALFLSYNPPHSPYDQVPEKYRSRYKNMPFSLRENVKTDYIKPHTHPRVKTNETSVRQMQANYFAAVTGIDDQFSRLLELLKEQELEENTVVVLSSDHGDMLGSHGLIAKHVWYEESIGIPLIIRYPGKLIPKHIDTMIGSADQMPTILGLMGVDKPDELEGIDLHHIFIDGEGLERSYEVIAGYPGMIDAQEVFRVQGLNPLAYGWRAIRSKKHICVIHKGYSPLEVPKILMYDLRRDPYQLNPYQLNLKGVRHGKDVTEINNYIQYLKNWLKKHDDPFDIEFLNGILSI